MQYIKLKRTIIEVFNCDTETEESALALLTQKDELIFQLRRLVEERIQAKNPLYVCNTCGQVIAVRSHRVNGSHTFYFKHLHNSGECPIKTDSSYTKDEICRMKYNGAKESRAHFQLKHYVADQLRKDKRFTDIENDLLTLRLKKLSKVAVGHENGKNQIFQPYSMNKKLSLKYSFRLLSSM
jgi:hypothetical protein